MKEIYLFQLNKDLRIFLTVFLLVLSIGVSLGLVFLFHTTSFDKTVTTNKLVESQVQLEDDFGINESKSKSSGELLMTTHNHILGFTFIFFFVGTIFYFNSVINGVWKMFFLIEPLVSILLSFGSMWAVRFWGTGFIYLTIISAIIMYISYFIMVSVSIYDLILKRHV
jgi:hypothetical protein